MAGEAASPGDRAGVNPGWVGAPGLPGRLPLSVGVTRAPGAGETAPAGEPAGVPSAPGLPGRFPRSPGATEALTAGEAIAPGDAAGEMPPAAGEAPAAPRVGGGIFFGFSVLIFSFSCASLATPPQPCWIFGCATLVFTLGGATPGAGLLIFCGAATSSVPP